LNFILSAVLVETQAPGHRDKPLDLPEEQRRLAARFFRRAAVVSEMPATRAAAPGVQIPSLLGR
jgi:hypothetical protein